MPRLVYMLVPLVPAAALLAPVPAATAMEPTRDSLSLVTHPRVPCPDGGVLNGTFEVDRNITTFHDESGTAIREEWWDLATGSWTNPLTGSILDNRSLRVFQRDLISGEVISTGTNAVTKLPDGGSLSAAPAARSSTKQAIWSSTTARTPRASAANSATRRAPNNTDNSRRR